MVVFTLLVAVVIFVTVTNDFSSADLRGILFVTAILCCILVAKNVLDSAVASRRAQEFKDQISKDPAFASKELYVELYQNSPVPYMIIDLDGRVQSANVAAVRMLGVSQEKIRGIAVFERLQSEEPGHIDLLLEKFQSGISMSDEMVQVMRPDEREAWGLLSLFRVASTSENQVGLLTLVDITKQKKTEDAKSQFVSLASHQLRTPIAGMKWSAELLQMDNPDALSNRQHKYIERLLTSINRMAVLVDDFLRVSRFELGTFRPEMTSVSLIDIFNDIMLEQAQRVAQKNIEVKTFFDTSLGPVISDQNLIRMMVTNLYSNAVKYTRPNGTIHIGFGRKDDTITISVADNGMGIPIADQDHIFQKLFRATNAVKDVPDGTGLGLYIVREAVRVLDGNISFTSTENVGTTFEVVLPLIQAKAAERFS